MARALRTTTTAEPKNVTDVLKSDFGTISRELVTIKSGEGVLDVGTVLGKVTASGKYVAHVNGATDGSQTAVAVLLHKVDATSADVANAVVCARLAEVNALALIWDDSVDSAAKIAAAVAQLAGLMIIARGGA